MSRSRRISIAVVAALLFSSLSYSYAAAPKAGAVCSKVGKKQVAVGKTFTCVKKGKKLVWSKGVKVAAPVTPAIPVPVPTPSNSPSPMASASPTPTPSLTPSPEPSATQAADPRESAQKFDLTPKANLANLDLCRLKTNLTDYWNVGFPRRNNVIPALGKHRAIVLVVEFTDLKANGDEHRVWKTQQIPTFKKYIEFMSYGQLGYEFDVVEKVFSINKSVLSYNLDTDHDAPMKPNASPPQLVSDAIRAADPEIDFSKYAFINVVTPATKLIGYEGITGINESADGKLFTSASFGPIREYKDDPAKYPWLVHESGHAFGLPHPYMNPYKRTTTYQLGAWDIMGNAITFAPDFMSWNKFLIGWLSETRAECVDGSVSQKTSHLVRPLGSQEQNTKAVFVKISDNEVLVVENRRSSLIDLLNREEEGVVVYVVDVNKRDNEGAVRNLYVTESVRRGMLLGSLFPGEKVEYKGIRIDVLSSAIEGDYVSVDTTKAESVIKPTSFDNLYEARKGISLAAWSKVSETIKANKPKYGTLEIYTGPNTKPYYEDYSIPISLVSRAFPNSLEPNKTFILRYNYSDLAWAEQIAREKIESGEYSRLQSYENNQLVSSNCSASITNCRGAKQQAARPELSFILHGIENTINPNDPSAKTRFLSGLLEAHEYFHSLQRMPIMNRDVQDWPHAWFREGSAEWAANAVVHYDNFEAYREFQKVNCADCSAITVEYIKEYLESAFANSLPAKFNQWHNYSMGSWLIEALVALKGQESIIEMYAQMGKRLTFNQAFKVIYDVEWSYAIPILAKTIHANLNGI